MGVVEIAKPIMLNVHADKFALNGVGIVENKRL
jgi:hypothetical protein